MNDITEETIKIDKIEKFGNSLIHHGKWNNRVYLMKLDPADCPGLLAKLNELAEKKGYSKMIAKIPASAQPAFLVDGYAQEAFIPRFFNGNEDAFFMSKFNKPERSAQQDNPLIRFHEMIRQAPQPVTPVMPEQFRLSVMQPEHATEMAELYRTVFKTYPFPVEDPTFLKGNMDDGSVIYFGIWKDGRLAGLSSAELDAASQNAEMTDFAVLPEFRGKKLAYFLLKRMEEELQKMEYKTLYTIARLHSAGMNRTFINSGYRFSGMLRNNTNIAGQIESMNVYYKIITNE